MDVISGIVSGISGLIGGGASYYGQREANRTNLQIARETNVASAQQAELNRQFQERMSNTQYQRTVADMKAAGINPMLAATLGGSSTPPGATATQQTGAPMQNELGGAVSSALDMARTRLELSNIEETNKQISSQITLNKALTEAAKADANLKSNSAKVADQNAQILEAQKVPEQVKGDVYKSLLGKPLAYLERIMPLISSALSARAIMKRVVPKTIKPKKHESDINWSHL